MRSLHRVPWSQPHRPTVPPLTASQGLAVCLGEPWSHTVAICAALGDVKGPELSRYDPSAGRFVEGPFADQSVDVFRPAGESAPTFPFLFDLSTFEILCDDPVALARALAPELFSGPAEAAAALTTLRAETLDAVYALGSLRGQAEYEDLHARLARAVKSIDAQLSRRRFLSGNEFGFSDLLLFAFSVRLDLVYYPLFKATIGLLSDFPSLEAHAQDLFEVVAVHATTDFSAIAAYHFLEEPERNPRNIVPEGGRPDLDAPHFRSDRFRDDAAASGTEEDQDKRRGHGEWVRPRSLERAWIRADGSSRYPAAAHRYHLYAPFNCPWSHRALLARSVKGLTDVVGASIVYFRRDGQHGWQFNPTVPGCTPDLAEGRRYVKDLYEMVGSSERSVPILWDTETKQIVSNESAEILRMFNDAFGDFENSTIDLYPESARAEIDRLNEMVYQRINNGAYKAGFAQSQVAYRRAFARYFRALDWVEALLADRTWLAGTTAPTEADLRLFPTIFRHDAIYYARFKLNLRRVTDYPRLSRWLARMLDVPGVREASNMDHARNGYFGRTGNGIVPAGPIPLELSPKNFSRAVWHNEIR